MCYNCAIALGILERNVFDSPKQNPDATKEKDKPQNKYNKGRQFPKQTEMKLYPGERTGQPRHKGVGKDAALTAQCNSFFHVQAGKKKKNEWDWSAPLPPLQNDRPKESAKELPRVGYNLRVWCFRPKEHCTDVEKASSALRMRLSVWRANLTKPPKNPAPFPTPQTETQNLPNPQTETETKKQKVKVKETHYFVCLGPKTRDRDQDLAPDRIQYNTSSTHTLTHPIPTLDAQTETETRDESRRDAECMHTRYLPSQSMFAEGPAREVAGEYGGDAERDAEGSQRGAEGAVADEYEKHTACVLFARRGYIPLPVEEETAHQHVCVGSALFEAPIPNVGGEIKEAAAVGIGEYYYNVVGKRIEHAIGFVRRGAFPMVKVMSR
ncbi:hypothetical protein K438DRAFT_1768383 [Mycena galopus ATCC 62051]|nr:hypothetical protein K438DRAFT_1768383 [Mycena galopus ATCC 62051]